MTKGLDKGRQLLRRMEEGGLENGCGRGLKESVDLKTAGSQEGLRQGAEQEWWSKDYARFQ